MDSMDNVRERCTALEQQTAPLQDHTHVLAAHTHLVERRQRWWHLLWRVVAVIALGLALVPPLRAHAATFTCGAGNVDCLIAAIHEANANGEENTITLAAGTYTLTTVDNDTDGPNGLPSITSALTLEGAGADTTILARATRGPEFRLVHVAASGNLMLDKVTLRGGLSGQGGGLFNDAGTVTLTQSTVAENNASEGGGALQ